MTSVVGSTIFLFRYWQDCVMKKLKCSEGFLVGSLNLKDFKKKLEAVFTITG